MKIIVPIQPHSFEDFEVLVKKIDNRTDIIEVWLDRIDNISLFLQKLKTQKIINIPLLGVCKRPKEKGIFKGSENDRVEILQSFLMVGGNFVDLDVTKNSQQNIKKIDPQKLILSFHDFEKVPKNLETIFEEMKAFNPFIYKFAVTPNTKEELANFLIFAQQKSKTSKKFIFTTMGAFGKVGRKKLSSISFAGFYALNSESKTASGQLCLDDL